MVEALKLPIGELFDIEKGSLQSLKNSPGEYDFITAADEWKTHDEFSHDMEALIFAAAASGSLGRTHYVNGKFITSDLCYILTPKNSDKYPIDLKFYHFVFNSLKEDIVRDTKSGTSKEAINQKSFKSYELPYFDIQKQHLWIQKLVDTKEHQQELLSELSVQKELVSKLRQSILQEAIEGRLTAQWRKENSDVESASKLLEKIREEKERLIKEGHLKTEKFLLSQEGRKVPFAIPMSWKWCKMVEIGIFERGKSKHRPRNDESLFSNGIYPFIQTGDVAQSKHRNYKIKTYSKKYNDFGLSQSRLWEKGTFCITIAANIAETGFLEIDACFPDSVVGFKSIDNIISKYAQYFFIVFRDEIERFAPATAQKNINLEIIKDLTIPFPPIEEQRVIVEKVENLFVMCDELEQQINESKANAEMLMQAVLKEAFKSH